MGFHYNAEPSPTSPTIVIVGSELGKQPRIEREAEGLGCEPRDVVRGRLTSVDANTLLSSLRQRDQPIEIEYSFSDAVALGRGFEGTGQPRDARRVSTEVAWDRATIYAGPSSRGVRKLPIVVRPAQPVAWARAAVLPLRIDGDRSSDLMFRVRARIQGGDAAFGIVPGDDRGFLARAFRGPSDQPVTVHLFVAAHTDPGFLMVTNGEQGSAQTQVEVQEIEVFRLDAPDLASSPTASAAPTTHR
jgi:hypothetical protein